MGIKSTATASKRQHSSMGKDRSLSFLSCCVRFIVNCCSRQTLTNKDSQTLGTRLAESNSRQSKAIVVSVKFSVFAQTSGIAHLACAGIRSQRIGLGVDQRHIVARVGHIFRSVGRKWTHWQQIEKLLHPGFVVDVDAPATVIAEVLAQLDSFAAVVGVELQRIVQHGHDQQALVSVCVVL